MGTKVRAGQVLSSAVGTTAVIVTRAPDAEVAVMCGGIEMATSGGVSPVGEPHADWSDTVLLGKRYADAAGTVEVLCTKGGVGTLSVNGEPLAIQEAKPLPSSD